MPASNRFKLTARSPSGGPQHLVLVTPSDDQDLPHVSQWVFLESSGALSVVTRGGESLVTPLLPAGWHLMELVRIRATGTTATGIMVGW